MSDLRATFKRSENPASGMMTIQITNHGVPIGHGVVPNSDMVKAANEEWQVTVVIQTDSTVHICNCRHP